MDNDDYENAMWQQQDEERRAREAFEALNRCAQAGARRDDLKLLAQEVGLGGLFDE